MASSMLHRGPDDDGYLQASGIGLAFRRLSIIDLAGGAQPIQGCGSGLAVVGNGEIYNYREVRADLLRRGHRFHTDSDIEVIVHGYEEWGDGVVHRLNGMFGFAVWDGPERRLLLARDHLGVKPLYYSDRPDRLLFGSEMRAILTQPGVDRELDPDALRLFLHFGYVPSPHTLVRGIRKLPPGHLLVSDATGCSLRRYWNESAEIDHSISVEEAVEEYAELTSVAVNRQMISDVPIGILLSAGVDSAMILAAATDRSSDRLTTFTAGFGNSFDLDETEQAAGTAAMFNTEHHAIQIRPDDFPSVFEHAIWHLEEPVLSQSTFAFEMLTRKVSEHVKVVLTGQGADEPWAGYHRYIGERYGRWARWLFGTDAAASIASGIPGARRLRRATESLGEHDPVRRFAAIHQVFSPAIVDGAAVGALRAAQADPEDPIRYWQHSVSHLDEFSQLLHIDSRTSLADDLLFYGDKLSMSSSVEVRVPFLDRELFDFVERLPPGHKLRLGQGKYVHRKAAATVLPPELVDRPKRGFDTPVDQWFAGEFAPLLRANVMAPQSFCASVLDPSLIRVMVEDHLSGRRNHRRQLTALLSLELCARNLFGSAFSDPALHPPLSLGVSP